MNDRDRVVQALEIPPGVPFDQPEQTVFTWDVALNADELIGLLGTFSWVILMEDERAGAALRTARRVLRDALGVSGDVTVDIGYRAEVWRRAPPRPDDRRSSRWVPTMPQAGDAGRHRRRAGLLATGSRADVHRSADALWRPPGHATRAP